MRSHLNLSVIALIGGLFLSFTPSRSATAVYPATETRETIGDTAIKIETNTDLLKETPTKFNFLFQYGQSEDFWTTVQDLGANQKNISEINRIMDEKFGSYEDLYGQIRARFTGAGSPFDTSLFRSMYFEGGVEMATGGIIQNPVLPRIDAYKITLGKLGLGFEGEGPMDFHTSLGLTGGWGKEEQIHAYSTALMGEFALAEASLWYLGLDIEWDRRFEVSQDFFVKTYNFFRPTYFHSQLEPKNWMDEGASNFTFRWKSQWNLDFKTNLSIGDPFYLGAVFTSGPQPLPVEILPRVWDYAHRLDPLPRLGALFGVGGTTKIGLSKDSALEGVIGKFGGYFGGEARLNTSSFWLGLGTWRVESMDAFESLGARVWIGSMGFRL